MEIFRLNIFDNIYLCREGGEAWINMINGSRCNRTKHQVSNIVMVNTTNTSEPDFLTLSAVRALSVSHSLLSRESERRNLHSNELDHSMLL